MADGFTVDVDASALLDLLARVGPSIAFHARDVARDTAARITAEASARVARREGKTAAGIHFELTRDGQGYVVMAYEPDRQPPVDKYLESGTKFMLPQPFFFASAALEEGPHLKRLETRAQEVLSDRGR